MSGRDVQIFNYNPAGTKPFFEEGATIGWLVIYQGPARAGDPVSYAPCVAIVDADGYMHVEATEGFKEGRIVE